MRLGGGRIKVALDGEVTRLRGPLVFQVLDAPLHLLKPPRSHAHHQLAGGDT
jgi:hypothetical protein